MSDQQKPIDLTAIQVGDEVLIRAEVVKMYTTETPICVRFLCGGTSWFKLSEIAAHIPKPPTPPATLAEFLVMPESLQTRVYAELLKKGGT